MDLKDAWMLYCEQRFPDPDNLPKLEGFGPRETALMLFENGYLFTARFEALRKAPYDPRFDEEADGALIWLARFDNFDLWDKMSAAGWRVMYERFVYALVVAGANEVAGTKVIARLPVGLDRQSQCRAVLLQFLLGGARAIDPRLLEKHSRQGLPDADSLKPIRRQ